MRLRLQALLIVVVGTAILASGCGKLRAKAAFKEGNRLYKEENFKRAAEQYQRAVTLDPKLVEAHFYLASSHQAMYRPGKESADNTEHLNTAVASYKAALEVNDGSTETLKALRRNTLGALTGIYSEDPYKSFETALGYAQHLVQDNPTDSKNLFAMANLYEKFGKIDDAEAAYRKAMEVNPQDVKPCGALAAFLNKPHWDGKSKFDEAVDTLQKCAALEPNEPSGYYKVATFFWDKAYRDRDLTDKQKDAYADKGLENVDHALQLKPDYVDALIYKGLLYRVKAMGTTNRRVAMQYLDQAQLLQKQAMELRKDAAAGGIR